jgi:hypothetical protein
VLITTNPLYSRGTPLVPNDTDGAVVEDCEGESTANPVVGVETPEDPLTEDTVLAMESGLLDVAFGQLLKGPNPIFACSLSKTTSIYSKH